MPCLLVPWDDYPLLVYEYTRTVTDKRERVASTKTIMLRQLLESDRTRSSDKLVVNLGRYQATSAGATREPVCGNTGAPAKRLTVANKGLTN